MIWSEERNELATAMAKAQGQITPAPKTKTATVRTKSGSSYEYKYSSLDDIWASIREALAKNGLSVIQSPTHDERGFSMETLILHTSGQWVSSGPLNLQVEIGRMSAIQALGSTITYARRYQLGAMIGVVTEEDDDGQASTAELRKPVRRKATPKIDPVTDVETVEIESPPKKTNGKVSVDPATAFWTYQRQNGIDKQTALDVLSEAQNDFNKGLELLKQVEVAF